MCHQHLTPMTDREYVIRHINALKKDLKNPLMWIFFRKQIRNDIQYLTNLLHGINRN